MEVEINQVSTSPTSLRFGCVVRYGEDGPVRFASVVLHEDLLDIDDLKDLMRWAARQAARLIEDERKAADQGTEPLF